MVSNCATKLTAQCSPIIGQLYDTMILASTDVEWLQMTHQNLHLGKCWKLLQVTLRSTYYGSINPPLKIYS